MKQLDVRMMNAPVGKRERRGEHMHAGSGADEDDGRTGGARVLAHARALSRLTAELDKAAMVDRVHQGGRHKVRTRLLDFVKEHDGRWPRARVRGRGR
jgi:hypothetical protein